MTRKTIHALALLLAGALPATAQDCETKACETERTAWDLTRVRTELAQTEAKLAAAQKKEQALTADQRKQLADARAFLLTQTADGRAFVPTLVSNARLLNAAAAQEEKAAGQATDVSRTVREMARAYATLAAAMNPATKEAAAAAVGVREARVELEKSAAVWQKVASEKSGDGCCADKDACKAAAQVMADLCTAKSAFADTMQACDAGFKVLAKQRQLPGGDATVSLRDEFIGEAGKLHAKLATIGACGTGAGCDGPAKKADKDTPVDTTPPPT